MKLSLFSIAIPRQVLEKGEKEAPFKEYALKVEQFLSSLASLGKSKKTFSLLGSSYFVFEAALPRIGEEIAFYVAAPRPLAPALESQILAFFPRAEVRKSEDYNIFNPEGFSAGAVAKLAKSPLYPIKFFEELNQDPMSSISSILGKLKGEGEGGALQILIRPSRFPIQALFKKVESLLKEGKGLSEAVKSSSVSSFSPAALLKSMTEVFFRSAPKNPSTQQKPPATPKESPINQEVLQAVSKKASLPLFDVNIRLLASSDKAGRAEQLVKELEGAFEQFNSPLLNQIRFQELSGKKLRDLFFRFSFRLFNDSKVLPLSVNELASIFHFPAPTLFAPTIKWLKAKQAPPPHNLPQEGLLIGKSVFRGEEKKVFMLPSDRRRHFYIIGQTGTGKSSLFQTMVNQDIEQGHGVCLIDPHGDLAERVLAYVPAQRAEDVIYFNPTDVERPIGLNMLETDPRFPEAKTFVVNELLEIFDKLYNLKAQGLGGPIYEQYMRNSLLLVMEDPESGNTLLEVPRVLSDKEFRELKLSRCKNIVVKNFWRKEAEKAGGEFSLANLVPYVTSKMNVFVANDLMRPIIAQEKSTIDFREIMDEGKIFIVNLSKGRLGDVNSYLLGMIIVGKLLLAAFSRANIPEEERKDFYLYIDEFHNVTTNAITHALAEARKFRLSMVFAHQFIGQLEEETRKAIFGNVGSILAMRVGPEDAKYLVTQFKPTFDETDLVNLDNYNGLLRLLIRGQASEPFNIVTYPPPKGSNLLVDKIKEYSRLKYGRKREIIEKEVYQRLSSI